MSATQFRAGHVSLAGCLLIILLSADFFIPMRQLGSFFHIAMNGMAASDKIFQLLDLAEPSQEAQTVPADRSIQCIGLRFSYEENREVLHGIDLDFSLGSFTAIAGESGCGKSTVANILMGRNKGYGGLVTIGGVELSDISEASLMEHATYTSHQSYIFKGTVRDNLLMGRPAASERGTVGSAGAGEPVGLSARGKGSGCPTGCAGQQPLRRPVPAAGLSPGVAPQQPGVHLG